MNHQHLPKPQLPNWYRLRQGDRINATILISIAICCIFCDILHSSSCPSSNPSHHHITTDRQSAEQAAVVCFPFDNKLANLDRRRRSTPHDVTHVAACSNTFRIPQINTRILNHSPSLSQYSLEWKISRWSCAILIDTPQEVEMRSSFIQIRRSLSTEHQWLNWWSRGLV